ncbi:MAG TPA: DUF4062 domain-containing protein [Pyrinomonadaceae bacterium]|nr:DUF4062 domain-containing protein [Pyrinomonadaceae bacterium]
MTKAPAVFVSSTFYDLKQIRADLKDFITTLGLIPVISEYSSFPIDPTISTVENCLKVVDENADIFVLIIGARYGTIKDQGKSITNMEYLKARAKGIPIYVFIEKSVLSVLPLWIASPQNDFSAVVDSPKLFEFVTSVRDTDAVWTLQFETAQDIIEGLRKQFAYLFMDALGFRQRIKSAHLPPQLANLKGVSLTLLLERPPYWEYQLFANTFTEEIKRVKEHDWDVHYGIILGPGLHLKEPSEVFDWISTQMSESERIVDSFSNLINTALPEALGPPGISGDPVKLVYVSQRLAETYKSSLEWAREAKKISVPDEYQKIVSIVGGFLSKVTKSIEDFSENYLERLNKGIAKGQAEGGTIVIDMTLTFELHGLDEFNEEINRLRWLAGLDEQE